MKELKRIQAELKAIPNHKDYYANDIGEIFSLKFNKIRKLKVNSDKDGYSTVKVGGKWRKVHRLVASAFIGDIDGLVVRHTNAIRNDNRVCNLLIGTVIDNINDTINMGRHARGESNGSSKLTNNDVTQIRDILERGVLNQNEIGHIYGVHNSVISRIKNKKSWSHV
jgi:hypothetical protein